MSRDNLSEKMPVKLGSNEVEIVDFRIRTTAGGRDREEIFGINVSKVTELLYLPERVVAVPDPVPSQLGMVSIRGNTIPVFDMGRFLSVPGALPILSNAPVPGLSGKAGEAPTLVVTEFSRLSIGFAVHRVALIRRVSWTDISPVDLLLSQGERGRKIVGTVLVRDGGTETEDQILQIVDLETIAAEAGFFQRQEMETDKREQAAHKGKTILIVDDSSSARKAILRILEKGGYDVVQESDGRRAFERLESPGFHVDLVLSDVEMPEMDGYTLVRKIRESQGIKDLPVILNSSMSGSANIKKGTESGADAYIVKMDPEIILREVDKFLGEKNG